MTYDNTKSHKKPGRHPFPEKHTFGKTAEWGEGEGGVESTLTLFSVNQKHFFISAVCESVSKNMNFCSLHLETLINTYSSSLPQGTLTEVRIPQQQFN